MEKILFYLAAFALSTILVNPFFYFKIIKNQKLARLAKIKAKDPKLSKNQRNAICYEMESLFCDVSFIRVIAFQIIFGMLSCLILFLINTAWFMPYTLVTLANCTWLFAILQFLNAMCSFSGFDYEFEYYENGRDSSLLVAVSMFVIFIVIITAQGIYRNNNVIAVEGHMQEEIVNIPTIDNSRILKTGNLMDGYTLNDPVYRNGNWIYIPTRDGNIESPGYFLVKEKEVKYVSKIIKYSENMSYKYNPNYVVREIFPTKALFGDMTLQVDLENNKMYYMIFYGEYKFLKCGRNIEGVILVDVENGKPIIEKDIPNFIEGIAE